MKFPTKTLFALLVIAIVAACNSKDELQSNFLDVYQSFSAENMEKHIITLSSDEFGGRLPSGESGKMTEDYILNEFKQLGLQPTNGTYKQKVPLASIEVINKPEMKIADLAFNFSENFVATSRKMQKNVSLSDTELVFVGYGINAPEYQWNDYQDIDVKGKTVVMLVNDPGYATQDPDLFNGNSMTYYGRWTYKYEEAARQGAAGAIIIHETKAASYPWTVVKHGWTGPQFHLSESKEASVDVEMWITYQKATELFQAASLDFEQAQQQAKTRGFKAYSLKNNVSLELESRFELSHSNNIMATIPGTEFPDEHIVYMGHWDHIGITDEDVEDKIFNGAHDNASGIAGIIELATAYTKLAIKPKRSITFLAVTAEEQGLLGSKYYADNPTIPFNKTIAAINMDSLNIVGKFQDIVVKGMGQSELEELLEIVAKRQQRSVTPEPTPERGYYYRSDHFSFAKRGVPALSSGGGTQILGEMTPERQALTERISKCYHQACDEYATDWVLDAAIQDLQLYFEMGHILSMSRDFPSWKEGSEFKLIREASMK